MRGIKDPPRSTAKKSIKGENKMSSTVKPNICSVCGQKKLKKEIFKQTLNYTILHEKFKETRHYFRWVCFGCNKSRWVSQEGIVLREGE